MTVTSRRPRRRAALAFVAASLLLALAGGVVAAHADLVSAAPANGSTVTWSPGMTIVLTFSEPLKTGSKADITGPGNSRIGTATIDPSDTTQLTFKPAAPLTPGKYTIAWTSIAQDGHVERSKVPLTFTVAAPATASPSAVASPSTAATLSPSPVATAAPTPSPSPAAAAAAAAGAEVLLPVLAAILAIAVLGVVLLRSRRASARR